MPTLPNPREEAAQIFAGSQIALMAHAIRATVNHFRRSRLELDILVIADMAGRIKLASPDQGATSVLQTRLVTRRVSSSQSSALEHRVLSRIFLHKDATKNLARICIAHELFHLLVELRQYIDGGRASWVPVAPDVQCEQACNEFALELCRRHDEFYKSAEARAANIYFPDGMFEQPLATGVDSQHRWPKGVALDPDNPFHRKNV